MAKRHGNAGQYAKSEAHWRSFQAYLVTMLVAILATGATCFACGYFWSRNALGLCLLAMIALAVLFAVTWKRLTIYMEAASKERIKYLRGAQAEALVAWILEKELEDDWHVFNGVKLDQETDHDHIVVGPGGIFLISTKSHRGWFVGSVVELKHNLKPCPFAIDARRQTAKLAARLKGLMGEGVPWVQAVLCVPFGYTDGDVFNGNVWLVHADDLTERIAPEKPAKRLSKDQVARAVKAMEMIQADAAAVYERPA